MPDSVRLRRIHVQEEAADYRDVPSAVGVELPSGTVVVEWVRESWPPDERLDHAHRSTYGSIDDLRHVVSGSVYRLDGGDDA